MPVSVPSYRHHKPSGRAVVTLNGRDFYLGLWNSGKSRQDYDRLIAEWIANGRQLPDAVPFGELTVVELAAAYLEFAKTYYVCDGHRGNDWGVSKSTVCAGCVAPSLLWIGRFEHSRDVCRKLDIMPEATDNRTASDLSSPSADPVIL